MVDVRACREVKGSVGCLAHREPISDPATLLPVNPAPPPARVTPPRPAHPEGGPCRRRSRPRPCSSPPPRCSCSKSSACGWSGRTSGVTLQTSSAVIGVALAAIAYGAWTGGLLADRTDPRRLLAPAFVLAAVATARDPADRPVGRRAAARQRVGRHPAAHRRGRVRPGRPAVGDHPAGGEAAAGRRRAHRPGGRPAVQHRHARRDHGHARHRVRAGRGDAHQRHPDQPRRAARGGRDRPVPLPAPGRPGGRRARRTRPDRGRGGADRPGRRRAHRARAQPVRRRDGLPLRVGRDRRRPAGRPAAAAQLGPALLRGSQRLLATWSSQYAKWMGAFADMLAPGRAADAGAAHRRRRLHPAPLPRRHPAGSVQPGAGARRRTGRAGPRPSSA